MDDAWVIMGDFNALCNDSEKEGRLPLRNESTEPFNDFIFRNGLMDVGYSGQRSTWTNFHVGRGQIKERLDRALCTESWRRKFYTARLYHE
ncbi:hypothetical protein LINPERHAP2_LOCUS27534 [Linum perenne]